MNILAIGTMRMMEFYGKKEQVLRGVYREAAGKNGKATVLFLHGFERTAITEPKFVVLCKVIDGASTLQFDYSDCGLSEGDFGDTCVESMADDTESAISALKEMGKTDIFVVAHSVSACVVAELLARGHQFRKMILLGPALNQRDLLRYWFTQRMMKQEHSTTVISWENYKWHLNEVAFQEDCAVEGRLTKSHRISSKYYQECREKDFRELFSEENRKKVLHIHGDEDDKVPYESVGRMFGQTILVSDGDHDLERLDSQKQWVLQAAQFLNH